MVSIPPKQPLNREFWLSTSLIGVMSLLLLVVSITMMALGGIFLPFGFDSDLIAQVFSARVLISMAVGVVLLVAVVLVYLAVRRRKIIG